jgi:hypothetical protein
MLLEREYKGKILRLNLADIRTSWVSITPLFAKNWFEMGDAGSIAGERPPPDLHYNDWPNTLGVRIILHRI